MHASCWTLMHVEIIVVCTWTAPLQHQFSSWSRVRWLGSIGLDESSSGWQHSLVEMHPIRSQGQKEVRHQEAKLGRLEKYPAGGSVRCIPGRVSRRTLLQNHLARVSVVGIDTRQITGTRPTAPVFPARHQHDTGGTISRLFTELQRPAVHGLFGTSTVGDRSRYAAP